MSPARPGGGIGQDLRQGKTAHLPRAAPPVWHACAAPRRAGGCRLWLLGGMFRLPLLRLRPQRRAGARPPREIAEEHPRRAPCPLGDSRGRSAPGKGEKHEDGEPIIRLWARAAEAIAKGHPFSTGYPTAPPPNCSSSRSPPISLRSVELLDSSSVTWRASKKAAKPSSWTRAHASS